MKINKIYYFLISFFLFATSLFADSIAENVSKQTIVYAQKDTMILKMDIYRLKSAGTELQPAMMFIFGGAFKFGNRDRSAYNDYFSALSQHGITVFAIDYRLGLVDKKVTLFNTAPADVAINMAVEDLFSATGYIIKHAQELAVDTSCIMVSGSSAGAVTSLHADYILKNNLTLSRLLPQGFSYKGILSFSGAIFSHKGTPDYKRPAAPTLFFHGNKDKIVPYNRIRFFRKGLFGSKSLAGRFKTRGYDYAFFTMEDRSHTVAETPMYEQLDVIIWFIDNYVYQNKNWQLDASFKDRDKPVEKSQSLQSILE